MDSHTLLMKAYENHKAHNAILGNNFMECAQCELHVHEAHDYLVKHWNTPESYDRTPITDLDDPRIK